MEQKSLVKNLYKTNLFLKKGSKINTEIFFRKTCCSVKKKLKENPLIQIKNCMKIIKPFCQIKITKTKGNLLKIPVEISQKKQQLLTTKFLLESLKEKKSIFMSKKIFNELVSIKNLNANSLKICESFQKNVETNKVFMQYNF